MTNTNGSGAIFAWEEFKSITWTAETVGASITGRVVSLEVRDGKSGTKVPVLTIEDADGGRHEVWAGAADLRQRLAELEPQVGDAIHIIYTGDKHVGQPSPMKCFVVERVPQPAVRAAVPDVDVEPSEVF